MNQVSPDTLPEALASCITDGPLNAMLNGGHSAGYGQLARSGLFIGIHVASCNHCNAADVMPALR